MTYIPSWCRLPGHRENKEHLIKYGQFQFTFPIKFSCWWESVLMAFKNFAIRSSLKPRNRQRMYLWGNQNMPQVVQAFLGICMDSSLVFFPMIPVRFPGFCRAEIEHENYTVVTEFVLLGLSQNHEVQMTLLHAFLYDHSAKQCPSYSHNLEGFPSGITHIFLPGQLGIIGHLLLFCDPTKNVDWLLLTL